MLWQKTKFGLCKGTYQWVKSERVFILFDGKTVETSKKKYSYNSWQAAVKDGWVRK